MKTKFFTLLVLLAFIFNTQHANAKIFRVGYWGKQIAGQDYPDMQSAHDAAGVGDTLLIFPGNYTANFSKRRLYVAGYGYYLAGSGADSGLQVITGRPSISVTLLNGCDSTMFQGLDSLTILTPYAYPGNINNIVINRCYVSIGSSVDANITLNNFTISQSYIKSISLSPTGQTFKFTSILLENNIINGLSFVPAGASSTGIINNNIFITAPNFNSGNYSLYNNIFLSTTVPSNIANCTFDYNIASNNTIPNTAPYNHNNDSVTFSTVFVGYPTQGTWSNDNRYMLAAGSPAIGAGENGIDCGIFGGTNPYRLGGIPSIPFFYKLTAPSNTATTNPYVITFSVRSNN